MNQCKFSELKQDLNFVNCLTYLRFVEQVIYTPGKFAPIDYSHGGHFGIKGRFGWLSTGTLHKSATLWHAIGLGQ